MSKARFPGNTLRERREQMGLSVEDAHRLARVPVSAINALETGHLERLPGSTYALGFLRSYCECLGLTPEPYIAAFHAFHAASQAGNRRRVFYWRARTAADENRGAWKEEAIAWLVAIAVILVVWVSYTTMIRPWMSQWQTRVEAGTVEAPATIDQGGPER
ncbi:MAG TPA: helix-turn-helix transcriptional regulator [Candidatus Hydrogenedentes bacterium]|nr:helix-turn-helix domain-containing protein [Candidatus Hydrogenedentota bacterium]HOJ70022.1 helix-turn-helix transcriptional regulator [Candidatus Hydrogenedentota bacterium]HOK90777.1 helix-turn-helix transcriptional regulator [Candidatus Hydrogenedentota bacterium]HOV60796.1 helix-turn-helix transcriptional regulator [Candidatus Hydrogenedentota bacterium]HPO29639.1 helix-turn-helix transcriptional regulator [Candidatus Hydrogenedentota bacterium]